MVTQEKKRQKLRCWCITDFDTKNLKVWPKLDLDDLKIRYFVYQLEFSPSKKLHIQAYIEFYDQIRRSTVKKRLRSTSLHAEPRNGTRYQARDYCRKDDSPWFQKYYPQWMDHGLRLQGTTTVELGVWRSKQGQRTDLDQIVDKIKSGAKEEEIFEACPSQYIKYSTGVRRARNLIKKKNINEHHKIKIHVLWGETGLGKTRAVLEKEGPENVYIPTYSDSAGKFWFDGYDGEKVLLINEFYGQARTAIMQQLLDNYRMRIEVKCDTTISAWDKIYITSNSHPRNWYNDWENIPPKVENSFIRRINTIDEFKPKNILGEAKTWEDCGTLDIQTPRAPKRPHKSPKRKSPKRKRRKKKKKKRKVKKPEPSITSGTSEAKPKLEKQRRGILSYLGVTPTHDTPPKT